MKGNKNEFIFFLAHFIFSISSCGKESGFPILSLGKDVLLSHSGGKGRAFVYY